MNTLALRCGGAALALASSTIAPAQTAMTVPPFSSMNQPMQQMRPWIIAEMPATPAPPPPPPPPAPEPIHGRIPTDPGYPTAPPSTHAPGDLAYADYLRRTAEWMLTAPIPSNPAEMQAIYSYFLAINSSIGSGHIQDPTLARAVGAYVAAYYQWVTRATGDPYGDPLAPHAAAAAREQARVRNEQMRLYEAALNQYIQDERWRQMVHDRFNNSAMDAFEQLGGSLNVLQLDPIYAGYDPNATIPPASSLSSAGNSLSAAGNSLSSAGNSLSSVGMSLSAAGTAVVSGTDDYNDPAVQSLYEVMYGLTSRRSPFGSRDGLNYGQLADATYHIGNFDLQTDPTGRYGRESGGYIAASLLDQGGYLRSTTINGAGGLNALLAQPFNVLLTWGAGAYDLDLHMTGPLGKGAASRFHIYYSAAGSLTQQPYAALVKDCVCNSGSEVILTSALNSGGVYRVSVFNFGDQSAGSSNLSNASQATIQIVRGGHAVSQGNGTTIVGGKSLLTVTAPNGQVGNTWTAAEINPSNGRITVPRSISQSSGSANVH